MKRRTMLALLSAALGTSACAAALGTGGGVGTGESRDIVIVSTTDVHGRVRGWDYYADSAETLRGLTRAATIVDSVRAANQGRVILLDAGDLLQGNPLAYVAARVAPERPSPIVAAMNVMRYDAAAIGNHEYNYGVPYLQRAISQARFPFLSANTYRPDGSHAFRPWTIVERQGIKVGIIGATTPGVMVWDAENVRGRVRLSDIIPAVRAAVRETKAAGASLVVVTVHSGLDEPSSYDTVTTGVPSENVSARIAREIPGIDLIVYGHSHREAPQLRIGTTLLVQPKNWATSVGIAHLRTVRSDGGWRVAESRGTTVQAAGHAEKAAVLAVTDESHRRTVAYANTAIGSTPLVWRGDSARLRDTPLIDFILETERRAAGADLASTAAFTLDASLDAGPVTVAELAQLYPYDNTLRAVKISGKQLRDYLEFSSRYYMSVEQTSSGSRPVVDPAIPGYNFDIVAGADYTMDLTRPIGSRITSLTVKGRPVAANDSFTLALNNYRQTGGGGYAMLHGAPVVYDKQQEIRQLLIDQVQTRKTLRPEDFFTQNWRLVYPGAASGQAGAGGAVGAADPQIGELVKEATARVASFVNRRVAEIATNLDRGGPQYPLGNLIADAQRWAGKGDLAVMNNGGIRANLRAGTATYGSLFEVQPFGNTLYSVKMTGSQLKEYLERLVSRDELRAHVSGVTIGYNPELPRGKRIVSLTLPAGRTLAEGAIYNVIVNDFLVTGGDGLGPPGGARVTPLNISDLDALVGYLKKLPSPVRAPAEARIFITQ